MFHILVVDDIPDNVRLLRFDLEDDGFEVHAASSGEECLDFVESRQKPDIVLLDMLMPSMSGIETLEKLKANENTSDIPVIMLSASASDENVITAIDLGAHDYVSKPIEYTVLAARIRSALRLSKALSELESVNQELHKIATTDALTSTNNRRQFFQLANDEISKKTRHAYNLSLLMVDIDHFKRINDAHGHAAGDQALIAFVECCKTACRDYDIVGRLGGEEFGVLLPHTDLAGANVLAERIRKSCENLTLQYGEKSISMTLSIGATELLKDETFEVALQRADSNLYSAKNKGRNTVVAN